MEVPAAFRERADEGVAQAKENYERIQTAGNEMTAILQQTYSTAAKGVADYNLSSSSRSPAPTPALFLTLPPSS
jgi:hypothetical protein